MLPFRSHSLKYFASVSSSVRSRSFFLKSSSFIQSGTALWVLWLIICLKRESLGMSGYTLARESINAWRLAFVSNVFIAALALISESVRIARFADVMRVMRLFLLLNERTGTLFCPFLGIILNVLAVSSRATLEPSESFTERAFAPMRPESGSTRDVSASSSGIVFFTERVRSFPFSPNASLYAMSALLMYPLSARSLNSLSGLRLDLMVSGPSHSPRLSIFTSIVSSGATSEMPFPVTSPESVAFEKLYRSSCDIFAFPAILAVSIPSADTFIVSGMNVCSESNAAVSVPSTSRSGSAPRRSAAPAFAIRCTPTVLTESPARRAFT